MTFILVEPLVRELVCCPMDGDERSEDHVEPEDILTLTSSPITSFHGIDREVEPMIREVRDREEDKGSHHLVSTSISFIHPYCRSSFISSSASFNSHKSLNSANGSTRAQRIGETVDGC